MKIILKFTFNAIRRTAVASHAAANSKRTMNAVRMCESVSPPLPSSIGSKARRSFVFLQQEKESCPDDSTRSIRSGIQIQYCQLYY